MAKEKEIKDNTKYIEQPLEDIMHNSMMPYSEYVIMDRAIPRVEDGLKPVQRRILYSMLDLGITPDKPHKKSARIVGECLGKYHPHGDSSVYGAMVKLAQPFSMSSPLIDGHGNFGSSDGDGAAAMRYTEARLTPLAMELLRDLGKDTVSMSLNFDDTLEEPDVLPGRFPNLLVNGTGGIAVGLTTKIPPHNLGETIDAVVAYIENKRIKLDEIMKLLPAPDFPTGGFIVKDEGVRQAYETGKGRLIMRANAFVEEDGDKKSIVVTEFPFEVQKSEVLRSIMALKEKDRDNFGDIAEIIDESDRGGIRAVIRLRRDADAKKILQKLFIKTKLQTSMAVNMVAIADGRPQELGLLDIISYYTEYQRQVIYKRTQYDLTAAKKREHILQGLLIAVNNIREVIDIILAAANYTEQKEKLKERFDLTEKQAVAVLDMQLKRLSKLDISKLIEEIEQLKVQIKEFEAIMSSKARQLTVVKKELLEIKRKYAVPRRTKLLDPDKLEVASVDLNAKVERRGVLVLTEGGFKFMSERAFNAAGKGVSENAAADLAIKCAKADNLSNLIAFTDKGNACVFSIDQLEDGRWKGKGTSLNKISKIDSDEKVLTFFTAEQLKGRQLNFYTRLGMVKTSEAEEYSLDKKNVYPAIVLREGDKVMGVELKDPEMPYILFVTAKGMALNAECDDIPVQGRKSQGVRSMQLGADDEIIFARGNRGEGEIVLVQENGCAKRVILAEIDPGRRYRKGVKLFDPPAAVYLGIVTMPYDFALVDGEGKAYALNTETLPISERTSKGKNILKSVKFPEKRVLSAKDNNI